MFPEGECKVDRKDYERIGPPFIETPSPAPSGVRHGTLNQKKRMYSRHIIVVVIMIIRVTF